MACGNLYNIDRGRIMDNVRRIITLGAVIAIVLLVFILLIGYVLILLNPSL
jgi:amino acid permease